MRPSDVIDELQRLPVGFMEQIVEYRRGAEAIRAYEADNTHDGPMSPWVAEFESEVAERVIARRAQEGAGQ